MTIESLKAVEQAELAQLCEAGAVRELHILEQPGPAYELRAVDQRGITRVLVIKRSDEPRHFKTADAAISVVKGLHGFEGPVTLHLRRNRDT